MDANILNLIGQFGFPIVACIGVAYFYHKLVEDNNARYDKLLNAGVIREDSLREALRESNETNRILVQTNLELSKGLPDINSKLDKLIRNSKVQTQ